MSSRYTFGGDSLFESRLEAPVTRPATCPSCNGRVIDTLAKVITPATCWRCRGCDHTWTLAATAAAAARRSSAR